MSNAASGQFSARSIPDHVPKELISTFSFITEPGMTTDPFRTVSKLHAGPRVLYMPVDDRGESSWLLTRSEDIRACLWDHQTFSSKQAAGFSALVGEKWDMIPLEIDPPVHTKFRMLLNPLFTPKKMAEMATGIHATATQLIDRFVDKSGCEFVSEFGLPFPVTVFLQLMGLPLEQTPQFLDWEKKLLHGYDIGVKIQGAHEILAYLRALAIELKQSPRGDLASFVVQAEIDGRPLTDDEIIGIYYLLFVGGLDTVASSLGFFFHYLATHPEEQAILRAHPEKRAAAIDEMLRAHSVVMTRRFVTKDIEFAGVQMKQGEWVTICYAMAGLDPIAYPDPLELKLDRSPNRHVAFAFGPHRCIGSHLAMREFNVALDEWFERIPPFRLKPGTTVEMHGGGVFGVDKLELVWD